MPELDIFLSWSGPLSQQIASYSSHWLPKVLRGAKPWMSSDGIAKGKPWFQSISEQLAKCPVCLLFVTDQNVHSAWLYYEAGAIAMANRNSHVCPYLVNVTTDALTANPLGQLQATRFDKEDTWLLIATINRRLPSPHDEALLRSAFDKHWPAFKTKVTTLIAEQPAIEEEEPQVEEELTAEAAELLLAASADRNGTLSMDKSMQGLHLQAGTLIKDINNPREETSVRSRVALLVRSGLIEDRHGNGQLFHVTEEGYNVADALKNAQRPTATLTHEARLVLTAAAKDPHGIILVIENFSGFHVQTNGAKLTTQLTARESAAFSDAINTLIREGLIQERGQSTYEITKKGFDLVDSWGDEEPSAPTLDESDILAILSSWFENREEYQQTSVIFFDQTDKHLNLPPGSAARFLEECGKKHGLTVEHKGKATIKFRDGPVPLGSAPSVFNPRR